MFKFLHSEDQNRRVEARGERLCIFMCVFFCVINGMFSVCIAKGATDGLRQGVSGFVCT
jgi:hypothetical protein